MSQCRYFSTFTLFKYNEAVFTRFKL